MAIIRCPACGKPNPDFLDVCQFCEQPLHPTADADTPAQPAVSRPAAADETLIRGGPATARCQACGRANPADMDVCQYCQARLKPLLAGERAAATPAAPTPTQLGQAGLPTGKDVGRRQADDTLVPAANLMNRLRSMGAATPLPADEPKPEPEPDEPIEPSPTNWMSRLRGMTDSDPDPTGLDTAAASNEPDWMWAGGAAETAATTEPPAAEPPADAPPPTAVTPGSEELPDWLRDANAPTLPGSNAAPGSKPRRKMTDWLNARPGAAPSAPPAVNDVPDWLKNLAGGASPLPVSGPLPEDSPAARAANTPPPAGTTDLPDWLKTIRTSTPLGGSEAPPDPQASSVHRMQTLPEWMRTGTIAGPEPLPDPDWEPPAAPEPGLSTTPMDAPPAPDPRAAASVPAAAGPEAEADADNLPTWLRAIITPGAADETIPVPNKPKPIKKMTDWLGSTPPPPSTEAPTSDDDLPDWLKAISAGESAPPPAAPPSAVADGLPDWLKPADALEIEARLTEPAPPPRPPAALPMAAATTANPAESAPALPADYTLPDWQRAIPASAATPADAVAPEPIPTSTAADLPDWLTALAPAASEAGSDAPALDGDTLAWLNTLSPEPSAAAPGASSPTPATPAAALQPAPADNTLDLGGVTAPAEAPAWLDELAAASKAPPAGAKPAPEIQPTPETELPEWLKTMRGVPGASDSPPEEMPDWLRAMRGLPPTPQEESPVRAPTMLGQAAESAAFQQEPAAAARPRTDAPADAAATLISGGPAAEATAAGAGALPDWLAAMRPVGMAQTTAGEADTYEERLGVLAGMRGVLRAEPSVAEPHRVTPAVNRLEVSELHSAHAKLLTDLQQSEAAAAPRKRSVARAALYVERWVVFAVLAVAIVLAQFQLPGRFGPPTGWPPEAQAAYEAVIAAGAQSGAAGTLPRPALIAFDYDAAQQGELNPAVVAIIRQLMGEGVPVVGVATRATGAAVGQLLLEQAAAQLTADTQFSYTYGTHYLNLGYIPGGPIGLLQFASVPRSAFQNDFSDAYGDTWVWEAPAVAGIETLGNFSLIVLISGAPEATRAWVEQAQLNAPDVPMIAVVSAAAEPLVRPYLTSDPAQLDGLVVGLGGGAALEAKMGRPGAATTTWPALGGGLLAAAVIILVGNSIFGLLALVRRRR